MGSFRLKRLPTLKEENVAVELRKSMNALLGDAVMLEK